MISPIAPLKGKKRPSGYTLIQSMTLLRIPLSVIFLLILAYGKETNLWLGLSLVSLLAIEFTDAFDGKIARRYGLVSESGAALDPYADSISRLVVYWALADRSLVIFLVPLVMAVRDVTVAYARIVLAQNNRTVSAKLSGKVKAIVQASGAFIALLGPLYWEFTGTWTVLALSWLIIVVTLLSAVEYVKDALAAFKAASF
ncbi:MAG: CDP-alcohol phosphatidyltransferase family protein [Candidatus Aminicenantales bacterium]